MKTNLISLIIALCVLTPLVSQAQISMTFDAFPYQSFSNPAIGLEDAKVLSNATTFAISHPFMFNENMTRLEVGLSWEGRQFEYRGFSGGDPTIESLYAGELSLTLTHAINEKWSLLGMVTPGLASDLKGDLTEEDFNFQAVVAGIRRTSPRFAYGFGAAYSTQFGEPIPLPVLLFDWNNGRKLSWLTILPVSSELWYAHSDRVHYGMLLHVRGNRFQGDPDRYDVEDPQLHYAVVTFGPSARFALANRLMLQVDAGMVPYHRFEFFNGTTKANSFNLKESAYARLGFSYDF